MIDRSGSASVGDSASEPDVGQVQGGVLEGSVGARGVAVDRSPTPQLSEGAVSDEVVRDEGAPHGRCQVCREPLPAPRRRQDGKYKGGRRRLYCPPPRDCKERAQAQRETRLAQAIGDPLRLVIALADESVPAMTDLRTVLERTIDALSAIKDVSSAEVASARAEVAAAHDAAAAEQRKAEQADERAARAVTEQQREQQARQDAEQASDRARAEAAQVKQHAAETVAAHQQARTQAERAAALAKEAEEALAGRLRDTLTRLHDETAARERAQQELAECRAELAAAQVTARTAQAADEAAQARAVQADERAAAAERAAASAATRAEKAEETAEKVERTAAELRQRRDEARRDADQARLEAHALMATVQSLERDRDAARADADRQRERAVHAELRAQRALDELARRDEPEDRPPASSS